MSYYFVIVGTQDNPLFEYEFGTSKSGGDGLSHFREEARRLNQFIVHSSLDIAEEVQWTSGAMYLRTIDRFYNSHISLFHTGARAKFLLLHNPDPTSPSTAHLFPLSQGPNSLITDPTKRPGTSSSGRPGSSSTPKSNSTLSSTSAGASSTKRHATSSIAHNPTSPQAEEAIRQFFAEVYENWIKAVMSPFYILDMPVKSPIFRQRVAGAARKYL